jgi:hypothetical protein
MVSIERFCENFNAGIARFTQLGEIQGGKFLLFHQIIYPF